MHVSHDCPTARAVWAAVADTWEAATTEPLDVTNPTLTVLGLRPQPPVGALGRDRARYYAREPAWRLLHAVTLLKLHQARTRAHMAYHDPRKARASPARLSPGTFSGPYARGVRTGSAMSMPKPCTPPALSPSLARDRAHGTLFTNTVARHGAQGHRSNSEKGARRPEHPTRSVKKVKVKYILPEQYLEFSTYIQVSNPWL